MLCCPAPDRLQEATREYAASVLGAGVLNPCAMDADDLYQACPAPAAEQCFRAALLCVNVSSPLVPSACTLNPFLPSRAVLRPERAAVFRASPHRDP